MALVITTGLSAQTDTWVTVALGSNATIDFPDTPQSVKAQGQNVLALKRGNRSFTALCANANLGPNPDSDALNKIYDGYIRGTMYSVPGLKLVEEKNVELEGAVGKEYYLHGHVKGVELFFTTRALVYEGMMYSSLYVTYDEASQSLPDRYRFFNSFKTGGTAHAAITSEPISVTPKLDFQKYLPDMEILALTTVGIFVFILLAVLVQYLFKRNKKTQQGPPVG